MDITVIVIMFLSHPLIAFLEARGLVSDSGDWSLGVVMVCLLAMATMCLRPLTQKEVEEET